MVIRYLLIIAGISILASCGSENLNVPVKIENGDSVIKRMAVAKLDGIQVEGRFIKIEKAEGRWYNLFIKLDNGRIEVFKTMMPIGENEIGLLKKNTNNIKLTYKEFLNPVTNRVEKMVKYMQPVYAL